MSLQRPLASPAVFPDWSGETAAIVAGGQSAADIAPFLAGRCRVIAVNLAFRLIPTADVLYAADSGFWTVYRDARSFPGLRYAPADQRVSCATPVIIPKDKRGRRVDHLIRQPVGTIGCGGGNSAFQAFNLAVQFGAKRILLAGIDYCGKHWHDDHPPQLRNPTENQFRQWRAAFDGEAPLLAVWGIEVINLSQISTLRAYPRVDIKDVNITET